jgi:carbonic anhydrase
LKKVYHFDSPQEAYVADAAVVWCFDHRFHLAFSKFLKRRGIAPMDVIKVAGGARCLASPSRPADFEFVLDQIRASVRLHGTKRAILMVHSDCGAYGGLQGAFAGDRAAEATYLQRELRRAAEHLKNEVPGIEVDAYFVDFEGVWDVDVGGPGGGS